MRRSLTPCALTRDGAHTPLARIEFDDTSFAERLLQEALHKSPGLLPIAEIDNTFGPVVTLGREIDCIDNMFVSPQGRLTLVETKLWRNPESGRAVVGQLLDYASRLSRLSYEEFDLLVQRAPVPALRPGEHLYSYVKRHFPDQALPESEFHDAVHRSLATGRFLLLIVGDGIREGVERMLGHLHDHPQHHFTFGLVEVAIYRNPALFDGSILIPSLIAKTTEVVRAVVRVETSGRASVSVETNHDPEDTSSSYRRRTLTEEEFFDEMTDDAVRDLYKRLLGFADQLGAEKVWGAGSVSIRLPDPAGSGSLFTLYVLEKSGDIFPGWLSNQLARRGLPRSISEDLISALCRLFPGVTPNATQPGSLSRKLKAGEVAACYDQFISAVADAAEAIRRAASQSAPNAD